MLKIVLFAYNIKLGGNNKGNIFRCQKIKIIFFEPKNLIDLPNNLFDMLYRTYYYTVLRKHC